jgi:hypothetical protein
MRHIRIPPKVVSSAPHVTSGPTIHVRVSTCALSADLKFLKLMQTFYYFSLIELL